MVNALRSTFAIRNTPEDYSGSWEELCEYQKAVKGSFRRAHTRGPSNDPRILAFHKIVINPTEAPWRNGAVEALVEQIKYSLRFLPVSNLTLLEFKTVLSEVTTAINNRLLGVRADTEQPLTPNQLLLGRN